MSDVAHAWGVYERENERARKQYERDSRTVDERYDRTWQEERYGIPNGDTR